MGSRSQNAQKSRRDHQRLKAGESLRAVVKSYRVHHATIGRLAGERG
jgi:hypothetical protein